MLRKKRDPSVETLRAFAFVKSLPDKEVDALASSGREVSHKAGAVILREGDSGVGFHIVLDGTARVETDGKTLSELGPGQFFGELSLLDGKPRSATVIATTDLRTFAVPGWAFDDMLKRSPGLTQILLTEIAKRFRAANG